MFVAKINDDCILGVF